MLNVHTSQIRPDIGYRIPVSHVRKCTASQVGHLQSWIDPCGGVCLLYLYNDCHKGIVVFQSIRDAIKESKSVVRLYCTKK